MRRRSVFLLCVLWAMALLCGCKQVQYMPVERVRTDSVWLTQVRTDSVVRLDSVLVRERGDTVVVEKFRYLYRDRVRTDTAVSVRTDTVSVPYPVERRLTRWERVKMEAGGYAIVAGCCVVLVVMGCMVYKLRKH